MKHLNTNSRNAKQYITGILTLLLMTGITAFTIFEATPFKNIAGSQIKVTGTSNLHDWNMNASAFTCEGSFVLKGDQLQSVSSLSFSLPVTNLKGKEDLLNTRAYKALKAEQFNRITFKLTNAEVVSQQKVIKAGGQLTIAGVTRPIVLQTNYTINGDEVLCKGSEAIKMSDYNISAPTFLMGALKVANEVTIDITLKLKNN